MRFCFWLAVCLVRLTKQSYCETELKEWEGGGGAFSHKYTQITGKYPVGLLIVFVD